MQRKPIQDIRAQAFIDAREKRGLSVEELASLACLSKKQIQQIENGQTDAFYSPFIKYTAAKKIASLIQLSEQEAFDLGPLAQTEVEAQSAPANVMEESVALPAQASVDTAEVELAPAGLPKAGLEPRQPMLYSSTNHKKLGSKVVWLLPIVAMVIAIIQFQPLIEQELDAFMAKTATEAEPAPVVASAPPADTPPATDAAPAGAVPAASAVTAESSPATVAAPAVASASAGLACPAADGTIENYKPPYANKAGDMVYVKTNVKQVVCVVDGSGNTQTKVIEPGLGSSFYGKPPFKLLTSGLASTEVYFQGLKVRPVNPDAKTILLVQVD